MKTEIHNIFQNWLVAILSVPAFLGILSWVGNWLPYSVFWNSPPYGLLVMQLLPKFMVLMIPIGFVTSVISTVFIYRTSFARLVRTAFYAINGIWIILSILAFSLLFFHFPHH